MLVIASTVNRASATATLPTTMRLGTSTSTRTFSLAHAAGDLVAELIEQVADVQRALVFQLVEDAVDQRQRIDAGLGLQQRLARAQVLHLVGLDGEQAHHDLKIVLHPVMDFPDQGGLEI